MDMFHTMDVRGYGWWPWIHLYPCVSILFLYPRSRGYAVDRDLVHGCVMVILLSHGCTMVTCVIHGYAMVTCVIHGWLMVMSIIRGWHVAPWIRVGTCGIHGSHRNHAYPHYFGNHEAVDTRGYA